jgi:hypothetical protein
VESWNESRFARWRKSHPWVRMVEHARRRCNCIDPNGWWPHYGAKGIKCHLIGKQLEEIWIRDGGAMLKKPSLDRINPNFDYANWNVRIIEFKLNSRLAWDPTARPEYAQVAPEFT